MIVWGALPLAIIVDDEISREPHQPVLQITLFRIVLIQGTVNANKDFLRQVFRRIGARSEAISEVIDPS